MRKFNFLLMIGGLTAILSACGSDGESQDLNEEALLRSSKISAAVVAGPDTPLYIVTLLAGDAGSYAIALNDEGVVVGNYLDSERHLNVFQWQGEKVVTVVENGEVSRVNKHGQIVGWRNLGAPEAFFSEADGRIYRLNALGGSSQALAINDSGQISGRITLGAEKAFAGSNGAMRFIAAGIEGYAVAMNNHGDVLIKEIRGEECRTLLWQNNLLTDLGTLGGPLTVGRDLNDAGQVVGWAETAFGSYHPFLWENGVITDLAAYTGDFGAAVAINEAGTILLRAVDMKSERSLLLAGGLLTDLGKFNSSYAVANDLNGAGQIVGWMAGTDGAMHAFLATPKE